MPRDNMFFIGLKIQDLLKTNKVSANQAPAFIFQNLSVEELGLIAALGPQANNWVDQQYKATGLYKTGEGRLEDVA